MKVSFITDTGETYQVEVDPQVEMENIMALLEAECGIPVADQRISHNGVDLVDPKATLSSAGVQEDAMLQLRRKAVIAGRTVEHDDEMMRLQLLGDPNIMRELRETQPELADAIQNNPQRFSQLLRSHRERQRETELASLREIEALNADPFNIEAQRRIEENIRQQAVMENMEHAMEYSPEFFGRVTMLYIPVEVNGVAGRDVDLLFGLDMLKAHQACIDLEKGVLRIKGREVAFLAEHQLPDKARMDTSAELEASGSNPNSDASSSAPTPASAPSAAHPTAPSRSSSFPGGGNTLGSAPASGQGQPRRQQAQPQFPESSIQTLVDLGATRDQAIQLLHASGGNVDIAASFLF
ncbi:DNA damage-inducible protein 1 [Ceratobasidium sp. 394]|nr:DNA damage-inducible protein 1 [Ceratobasidium sp. 394]